MRYRVSVWIASGTIVASAAAVAAWQARDGGLQGATPGGSGVVTGVILTETADPQPVPRATVRLSGDGSTIRVVGTDDDGRFVFDRLPAGRFTVSASKPGLVTSFHGSTRPGRGPGVPVAIEDGRTVEVVMRLLPGAVITGIVTDTYGRAAPGVMVAALDARSSNGGAAPPTRVVTDDRGVYRIFGLAPGEYVVSAVPQLRPAPAARGIPTSTTVTVVTEADVQRARGEAQTVAGLGGQQTAASSDPARPVAYAPVFYPGTTDASAAAAIRVASGDERAGVDISLRVVALARLAGTLVDGNGQPVPSATVSLVPKRGDQPSPVDALVSSGAITLPRATMSPGEFAFSGVAPGQYTLVARTGSGQRGLVGAEAASPTLWSVVDVVVDGADRSDLGLRLLPGLSVTGRLVFEGDRPSTVNLLLVAINPLPGVASTFRAALQEDGTFRLLSVAPGYYLLQGDASAGRTGMTSVVKSAVVGGRDLADQPLEAIAGASELSDVVVTFTSRLASISGRLIDAADRPVTRYSIVVVTQDRALWVPHARRIRSVQPATDGSFAVSGLPAGAYAIAAVEDLAAGDLSSAAFLSALMDSAFKLTLGEGEQQRQDLRVGR